MFKKLTKNMTVKGLLVCLILSVILVGVGIIYGPTSAEAMTALPMLIGMAVTTQKSTQETNRTATPPKMNPSYNDKGRKRAVYFSFTQDGAGDANSLANLVHLPPGNVRLIKDESRFVCSAFGAGRTLDIGYLAHTKQDGTAVAASIDGILDGADVSAAAAVACGAGTNALGTDPTILFDSQEGVTIQAKCLGDTLPDGATLAGYFTIVID